MAAYESTHVDNDHHEGGVRAAVIAQLDVLDVALEFPPRDVAPREPLSLPHVVVPLFTDPPSEEREHSNDDD